jgi:hypothetical protein
MIIARQILIALLLLISSSAFAQTNLVLNADFEKYDTCPTNNDQINTAKYWSSIDSALNGFGYCRSDYCNVCANGVNPINSIPKSFQYWQYAHSGNGMAQVLFFDDESTAFEPNRRDYLQGRLSNKLTTGKSYCVTFYVCLSECSAYATKNLSAYLDNGSIDTASNCGEPQTRYNPQINFNGSVVTDTTRWTKVEGSFVASGTEKFITIGNFKSNANTTYTSVGRDTPFSNSGTLPNRSAYLIDDVSVVESTTKAYAGPDTHVGTGDSIYIGRPMSEAIWCTWTILGSSSVIGQGPGIWVKPSVTTSYVVTQTLCGTTTKDTVKVEVWKAGLTSIKGQSLKYSLSPNPATNLIHLDQSIADSRLVDVEIYEMGGRLLRRSTAHFSNRVSSINIGELPQGFYFLKLTDFNGVPATLRFVKE